MIKYSKIMALCILGLFLCCNVAGAVQIGEINSPDSKEINTSGNMDFEKVPVPNSSSKNKELKKPITEKQKTTSPQVTNKKIIKKHSTNTKKVNKNQTTKNNTASTQKTKNNKNTQSLTITGKESLQTVENTTSLISTSIETPEKNQTVKNDNLSTPTSIETPEENQTVENQTANNTLENNTSMDDANYIKIELKNRNISVVVSHATKQDILDGTATLNQCDIVQLLRNGKFTYAIYQGYDNGNFFLNFGESMDRSLSYNQFFNLYTGIKLTAINGSSVFSALDEIDEIQNTPSGYQKRMNIANKILQYTTEITGGIGGTLIMLSFILAAVPDPTLCTKNWAFNLLVAGTVVSAIAGVVGFVWWHLYDWF